MNDSMLPEGYNPPKSESAYLSKFEEGKTKIRPLEKVTLGWVGWVENAGENGKDIPEYFRHDEKPTNATKYRNGLQEIWIFPVYNHEENRVQICTITQNSIKREMWSLFQDWGLPYSDPGYDIVVNREGTSFENTNYTVQPAKPEPLSEEAKAEIEKYNWNVDNQFVDEEDKPVLAKKDGQSNESAPADDYDEFDEDISPEDIPDIG